MIRFSKMENGLSNMNTITEYIAEHMDMFGHDLKVGDFIQFKSADIWPWGQIIEITDEDKPKYIVKTLGWRGNPDKKPKDQYKVKVDLKNLYQVNINFKDGEMDKLKKDGIII